MPKLPNISLPIKINLLPQDPFMESIVGKFLVWSLSIGRYIVVLTEFVVIMSFLSRFKLDRDLTDLNEAIERQKNVILSYSSLEADFITAQTRINFIKQKQKDNSVSNTLVFLEQNLPIDVKLSQVSIQPLQWSIEASALSASGLKATVDHIVRANPEADVSLGEVKLNSQTNAVDFTVRTQQRTTPNKPVANQNSSEQEAEL